MMDDPNFDKLMEEIFPMSIPTEYVESILVTLASGQIIEMTGDELLHPLPLADDLNWEKLVHRFDKIADVQVKINVAKIKQDVATNVRTIMGTHFDEDDAIDPEIKDENKDTLTDND